MCERLPIRDLPADVERQPTYAEVWVAIGDHHRDISRRIELTRAQGRHRPGIAAADDHEPPGAVLVVAARYVVVGIHSSLAYANGFFVGVTSTSLLPFVAPAPAGVAHGTMRLAAQDAAPRVERDLAAP